jgi:hypothetical protein
MSEKESKARDRDQSWTVYQSSTKTTKIDGGIANCSVQDGSLLFSNASNVVVYVFGPGQWISVNVPPVSTGKKRKKER